jgi:predicted DNA-binding ribbon-helix-helix protein
MGRPPGRTKTARISVSFEPQVYGALVGLARREDVPVAQIIRRAVAQLVAPETATNGTGPDLPSEDAAGRA